MASLKHEGLVSLFHNDAVVNSAQGLDSERYTFYVDLALSALGGAVRAALEAKMRSGNYAYQSELVRELVGKGRCTELEQFERWLRTAATAQSVQELF